MFVIAVVDDDNGMMFNHRRQSQDKALRQRILDLTCGSRLWMSHYTEKQFRESPTDQIQADDAFLRKAAKGEFCFVEDASAAPYMDSIEKIYLFKWNRRYPGDFHFDIDVHDRPWILSGTEDFQGSSHEKITMEVYEHAKD